ncbi:hypothetical protein [Cellulomonas carbonis]|uniref:Uncharacterized protein n=1 Tax=Cellulomonas carbonis T26 TaxID=947969 RepID=A0A0A0BXF7_9CELL|nr:hypothetical protein [Cellulomonas carbonis]KGM11834.1 hypothetical protein N868_06150 [Cellulomonas carbonis T26]GGB92051.1 hypothetical protein GCM10010972_00890 [Cellulomonas carbonis]
MPTIPVETYTLGVARNGSNPYAHVTITGPVLAHGIQNRATLYFFPTYAQLGGYALNVGGLNFDGIHVIGLIPFGDFDRMYDVLRNEAPVHVYYSHGSSSTTTKPLTNIAIQTGPEQPGEGPADADAVDSMISMLVGDLKAPLS